MTTLPECEPFRVYVLKSYRHAGGDPCSTDRGRHSIVFCRMGSAQGLSSVAMPSMFVPRGCVGQPLSQWLAFCVDVVPVHFRLPTLCSAVCEAVVPFYFCGNGYGYSLGGSVWERPHMVRRIGPEFVPSREAGRLWDVPEGWYPRPTWGDPRSQGRQSPV